MTWQQSGVPQGREGVPGQQALLVELPEPVVQHLSEVTLTVTRRRSGKCRLSWEHREMGADRPVVKALIARNHRMAMLRVGQRIRFSL